MAIHPTAIVAATAQIGEGVTIGPYCIVGPDAVIGEDCELISHVVIEGHTTIGQRNRIHPFSVLGHAPQDLKHKGEPTRLSVGDSNVMREHVTMNVGTVKGGGLTRVGNGGFFMINSHVGHDCVVGDHVTLVNNVALAGHCELGDNVIMGGGSGLHQFTRVGHNAFVGGMAAVEHDVIPYGMAIGNRAYLGGLNIIGLKRRGALRADIHALRQAYRVLFDPAATVRDQVAQVEAMLPGHQIVEEVLTFIKAGGKRSLLTPRAGKPGQNGPPADEGT